MLKEFKEYTKITTRITNAIPDYSLQRFDKRDSAWASKENL